ncbi:hypothetical protein COLO4_16022 [Corchorus olitorius]|uniref:Uncharacterized protein n=1 Tax=Corchorus olitorius TaxID=93759 RepID=A0A1R3JKE6_9ROSI|nr:hypothetical protein COLO4_16022 [Corchorus olitorius]
METRSNENLSDIRASMGGLPSALDQLELEQGFNSL